ncbi:MAG: M67 family metallopeptidase [Alphaproteobacteria bacterium]|nr:M67 family metallopeptidase [Alphaproteobacteria bacterium]MDX5369556.1 M67 family metallopeptidase [Alphaproteobacteria bacterium]MDX5464210.1 M67 family metallopeptidase [Alphaproteobacteria bacterium]
MTPTLEIGPEHRGVIRAAAKKAWPAEACGLLVGTADPARMVWRVAQVVESPNLLASARDDRFEVDPALLLRTHREAREAGLALVGLYHSHPRGAAVPSETDRRSAWQPALAWVIVAGPPAWDDLRAFLNDGTDTDAHFTDMRLAGGG